MWEAVKAGMDGYWDAVRLENGLVSDLPDVEFCLKGGVAGWLELETIAKWPMRAGSIVRVPQLTAHKKLFNRRRRMWGGNAFVLVKVEDDWFIFSEIFGLGNLWNKKDWYANCKFHWTGTPNWNEFRRTLKGEW